MTLAWVAHLYTALGAVLAFAATEAVFRHDFRTAFLVLVTATAIDATDGLLARALRVKARLPHYDGARLDDIVDYLTYVFVPALVVWRAGLVPEGWTLGVVAAVLISSAYGFGQAEAKTHTTDHFFTGFPSYWNVTVLYLYAWGLPPAANAAILLGLAVLVFVPVRYIYPSRTRALRIPTLVYGAVFAVATLVLAWRLPATDGPWMALSASFVVYYFVLSFWLHFRPRTGHPSTSLGAGRDTETERISNS